MSRFEVPEALTHLGNIPVVADGLPAYQGCELVRAVDVPRIVRAEVERALEAFSRYLGLATPVQIRHCLASRFGSEEACALEEPMPSDDMEFPVIKCSECGTPRVVGRRIGESFSRVAAHCPRCQSNEATLTACGGPTKPAPPKWYETPEAEALLVEIGKVCSSFPQVDAALVAFLQARRK